MSTERVWAKGERRWEGLSRHVSIRSVLWYMQNGLVVGTAVLHFYGPAFDPGCAISTPLPMFLRIGWLARHNPKPQTLNPEPLLEPLTVINCVHNRHDNDTTMSMAGSKM